MELKKKLGRRIQELRHKNNLKQAELAELVGIATKSQSCIETGKNYPTADLVERYAKTFQIELEEIFEFGHIQSKDELLKDINTMIGKADDNNIMIIYKFLKSLLH